MGVGMVGKGGSTADGNTKPKQATVAATKTALCSREMMVLSIGRPELRSLCNCHLLLCNCLWAVISSPARSTFQVCFIDQILHCYVSGHGMVKHIS